jgi:hypothetical protein
MRETTSELLLICQYQFWTPKEKLQNFYQKTELFDVLVPGDFFSFLSLFFSVLLTSPSLFSYLYSYPLHFPCVTIHCSFSQLLFLPLLIHSLPVFTNPFYPSPTCQNTTPPSYTLTTHWLAYCSNCTQHQPPEIPDTSTLHYNNRNTPKHTQRPQKPTAPYPFPNPPSPFSHPIFYPLPKFLYIA